MASKSVKHFGKYILSQHEQEFNKALHQASFLFNISLEDEHFDIDKDVHNKALMLIDEIDDTEPNLVVAEKLSISLEEV